MIPDTGWRPTNAEYHASPGWSSSMLRDFRESPRRAWETYVERSHAKEPTTQSMAIGAVLGRILLPRAPEEPGRVLWAGRYGRGSKDFREARERAEARGLLLVTAEENDTAENMAAAVLRPETEAARLARDILGDPAGVHEWAYSWLSPSGAGLRVKLDCVRETPAGLCIAELKTTLDPSPEGFGRQCATFGYDIQAALYVRGLARAAGVDESEITFLHIAIRNEAPYEVAVYDNTHILNPGTELLDDTLGKLRVCFARSPEPFGAPWERPVGELPTVKLPRWRYYWKDNE